MNGLEKRQKKDLLERILKSTKEFINIRKYEIELDDFFEKEVTEFLGISQESLKKLDKKGSIDIRLININLDILISRNLDNCNYCINNTYRSKRVVIPINKLLGYPIYTYGQSEYLILRFSEEKINEIIEKLTKLVKYKENYQTLADKLSKLSYQELKDLFPEVEEDNEKYDLILRALKNFQNRI